MRPRCANAEGDDARPLLHDKRLLALETEFANVLTVARREGNTVSRVIRDAWDGIDPLATMTKEPLTATGALISAIGHITAHELRVMLDQVSMANGFANRFLYAVVKRSRLLPHGGAFEEAEARVIGKSVGEAVAEARTINRVTMTAEAATYWEKIYPELSRERSGLFGVMVGRAEAQTIRLAMLYALLARSKQINFDHLEFAHAVWDYSEASVHYIFGDALGDPVADEIDKALRGAGENGMARTDISALFNRHRTSAQIGMALGRLEECGLAVPMQGPSKGGRPTQLWISTRFTRAGRAGHARLNGDGVTAGFA